MPRIGRLHIPGGYYHVMGRGLERRHILATSADKRDFIDRLEAGLSETGTQCLAWALMGNHYHLLLRAGSTPLADLMRKLLGGFATAYNRRHSRVGYVFQNRYKSVLCNEEVYLLELVRYIHLNPLRAKIVENLSILDRYRWTGHAVLMGNQRLDWQQTEAVLEHFGHHTMSARCGYRAFMMKGMSTAPEVDLGGGGLIRSYGGWQNLDQARKEHERKIGDERILGDSTFVEKALRQDRLGIETRAQLVREGWNLEILIVAVCAFFRVDPARIVEKARSDALSAAKSVICYFGRKKLLLTTTEIGLWLEMGPSAVSMSSQRGKKYCQELGLEFEALGNYRA